jgi:microcompartment protein CcmK/EutM
MDHADQRGIDCRPASEGVAGVGQVCNLPWIVQAGYKPAYRNEAFMFLAKVTGSVVATQKIASMTGRKLLTVEPLRIDPAKRDKLVTTGRTFVVVDTVGAGQGEMVLIVQGSSARMTPETEKLPVDAVIIGIVDTVNVENQTIFSAAATR